MKFSPFWNHIPQLLFPRFERIFAEVLTEEHKKIIAILEVVRIEESIHQNRSWTGRPAYDWVPFARFFVAKAVLNIAATRDMIARVEVDGNLRRILGWKLGKRLPDESAFSRVNSTLACLNIPLRAQEALANAQVKDRGICHTAHDSSAIKARETARNTRKSVVVKSRKRGRPRKGESVVQKVPSGVERYLPMTPGKMERAIPKVCNWGGKKNSQGKHEYWKGYKLHVSVVEGGLPVACLLTSASVHDSQASPFLIKSYCKCQCMTS
ncbi:MAG: transposase [Nitrospiraceae bacterium]|nr:transposase [Nitrospiraceae bacterium]